jgi:hypothetical protein
MTAISYKINEYEQPYLLVNKFNTALPTAGQPLAGDGIYIDGSHRACYINLAFSSDVSAVLSVTRTVGATTKTQSLNGGTAITAEALYQVTILVTPGETLNVVYAGTTGTYELFIGEVIQNG